MSALLGTSYLVKVAVLAVLYCSGEWYFYWYDITRLIVFATSNWLQERRLPNDDVDISNGSSRQFVSKNVWEKHEYIWFSYLLLENIENKMSVTSLTFKILENHCKVSCSDLNWELVYCLCSIKTCFHDLFLIQIS